MPEQTGVVAFIRETDTIIEPFGDHPRDLPILNQSLYATQRSVLDSLDIDVLEGPQHETDGPTLVFDDTVYFSRDLLQSFIDAAKRIDDPSQCVIVEGAVTERTVTSTMTLDEYEEGSGYQLFYYPDGYEQSTSFLSAVVDPQQFDYSLRFPAHMVEDGSYPVPITTELISQIEHWANLWAINVAGTLEQVAQLLKDRVKQVNLAMRAFSRNQWKVAGRNLQVGQHCDIHPTSVLENSIVGDDVEIGAGSVIRGSVIGNGTVIRDNVNVAFSVLGEGCQLQSNTSLNYSLLFDGAFSTCHFINCSVLGRDSFFGAGSMQTDFRFDDRNVVIIHDGRPIDSGQRFLGGCLGHGSYVGSGLVVAPGRTIPNETRLLPPGEVMISDVTSYVEEHSCL